MRQPYTFLSAPNSSPHDSLPNFPLRLSRYSISSYIDIMAMRYDPPSVRSVSALGGATCVEECAFCLFTFLPIFAERLG